MEIIDNLNKKRVLEAGDQVGLNRNKNLSTNE
jgi:hypothetical protein